MDIEVISKNTGIHCIKVIVEFKVNLNRSIAENDNLQESSSVQTIMCSEFEMSQGNHKNNVITNSEKRQKANMCLFWPNP